MRHYFLQPRPEPNRLDPKAATQTRRALTRLRNLLPTAHKDAIQGCLLVEARQSSRIESIGGEPTPDGRNLPSRLAQAVAANRNLTEAHATLFRDLPIDHTISPGQYRQVQVRVGGYYPPPPNLVPGMMRSFLSWQDARAQLDDPLLAAIWGHAWFETIHPFADGNGRTGRMLVNKTLGLPMLTLSRSIYRRRQEYYNGLNRGHWPEWHRYMLEVIREAARETAHDLRRFYPEESMPDRVKRQGERHAPPWTDPKETSNRAAHEREIAQALETIAQATTRRSQNPPGNRK